MPGQSPVGYKSRAHAAHQTFILEGIIDRFNEEVHMTDHEVIYFCNVCGNKTVTSLEVPAAPQMAQMEIQCEKCTNKTHLLLTKCPRCKQVVKYFVSDLDFPAEVRNLAKAYLSLIAGIKMKLQDVVEEFNVPVPKKWSVQLECSCGHDYTAELPLPVIAPPAV
jgi:hypothetical protein